MKDTVIERSADRGAFAILLGCERRHCASSRIETRLRASALREQPPRNSAASVGIARAAAKKLAASVGIARAAAETQPPYPGRMNPRVRRLIVSGVLGGLVLIVVVTAAWNWLR